MPTARGWRILPTLLLALTMHAASTHAEEEPQSLLGWRSSTPRKATPEARTKKPKPAPSQKVTAKSGTPLRQATAAPDLLPTPAAAPLPGALPADSLTPDSLALGSTSVAKTPPSAGPRALLVRNPNAGPGDPPFALTDDRGQVQRLVEPTIGVDLGAYVGQVVRVNHDTGATLLASQLDLPSTDASPIRIAFDPTATRGQLTLAQGGGEPLPEPIVLEEVTGVPDDAPAPDLQFPSSLRPAPAASGPVLNGGGPAACVGCGAIVQGPYGYTACGPNCPLAGWRLPSLPAIGGWDFSVDALFLRTHDSAGVQGGSDYDLGSRWELGFRQGWDRRLVLRYMEYDTDLGVRPLDLETFDIESQRWFPVGSARIGLGGGLRWAEYNEAGGLNYSESIGPVIGVYGRAPAFGRVDGLFTLRQSWQFGDAGPAANRGTFGVTELQFGLERRRQSRLGETFVRGLFETQYWNDVGATTGTANSSRGMIGFGLGAGIRR